MNLINMLEMVIEEINDENHDEAIMMLNNIMFMLNESGTQICLVPKENKGGKNNVKSVKPDTVKTAKGRGLS